MKQQHGVFISSVGNITGNTFVNEGKYYKITNEYDELLIGLSLHCVDRICKMTLASIKLALNKTNIDNYEIGHNEINLVLGTEYGALDSIHSFDYKSVQNGALKVNPSYFPNTVLNSPACQASIQYNFLGPIYSFYNGSISSLDAIGYAFQNLKNGLASLIIAGGVDEISELSQVMHITEKPYGEASIFFVMENNKPGANAMADNDKNHSYEVIDYYSIHFFLKNQDELENKAVEKIIKFLDKNKIHLDDINKFYFSITDLKDVNNFVKEIFYRLKYDGDYYISDIDWLGVNGAALISQAIEEENKSCNIKNINIIICMDDQHISSLILKTIK